MGMLCAVTFNRYGKLYYLDPGEFRPRVGDKVLVHTDDGPEVADCVWAAEWSEEDTSGFPKVIGIAGPDDVNRDELIRQRKAEARVAANRLIREHQLPMKVIAVDHVPGGPADGDDPGPSPRTTVYFTAPHRVDFRSLVRDLGATLRCRVELRQLSARDSAKVQGGIGSCGRDLCCSTFLTEFEPVSIRMAKEQDLPLNPMRISGACGRLMCCLKYEHPLYSSSSTNELTHGQRVTTVDGEEARVVSRHAPSETVVLRMASDGSVSRCKVADTCGARRAYETRDK
ncbi:regulatory iron-sulfur-containing complex subunit RicT [Catellatospora citrea]|uniref:PSP1 domain-containing protein n=1 Tax=Catellatospora citrea TaxID=53366 RepID=UPI0034058E29